MLARHAHYANVGGPALVVPGDIDAPPPSALRFVRHDAAACRAGRVRHDTYTNPSHPGYGDAEYKSELAQCRSQNSKVVIHGGYDDKSALEVDEDKARTCMSERGWQAVSR